MDIILQMNLTNKLVIEIENVENYIGYVAFKVAKLTTFEELLF